MEHTGESEGRLHAERPQQPLHFQPPFQPAGRASLHAQGKSGQAMPRFPFPTLDALVAETKEGAQDSAQVERLVPKPPWFGALHAQG